ncbi:MAG TPA: Na+/H+ antiporter NhaA, partial [Longimicrobiales bacterium]|nr:Na+/H+ antiporter NhaA [Longimicrobiales bacterium]
LPVFALANAGVAISAESAMVAARSPVALGIVVGLLLGKLVGILGATWLAVKTGIARLPAGVGWLHLAGVSLLAGIGFTVSLFISDLAFADAGIVNTAKLGILVASAVAGALGYVVLRVACLAATPTS